MGLALLRLLLDDARLHLVAAISDSDLMEIAHGVPVLTREQLGEAPAFDIAVDFSQPEGFDAILSLCRSRRAALVSGTTGLSPAQWEAMQGAGAEIPVLWASNFSLGVVVMADIVRRAARSLPDWEIRIVETHHVHKKDAPSGTAISLAGAVADGCGRQPEILSLREGEAVGEHVVRFAGAGEVLELSHSASDRDIFARGALTAAVALFGQPAGRYQFADLVLR